MVVKKEKDITKFRPNEPEEIENYRGEEPAQLASTLAVRHIIKPGEDKLQEVSYLSFGLVHPLTMLQAYEKPAQIILDQIKERRLWFFNRYCERLGRAVQLIDGKIVPKYTKEEIESMSLKAKSDMEQMSEDLDQIDLKTLFPAQLRKSVYQHSRGKDGKFIESLVILSDTEMQTRGSDDGGGEFSKSVRNQ
jgi:hypothetical protein